MSPIKFSTPIVFSPSIPTSFKRSALQFVDDYFFLKGQKAEFFNLDKAEARLVYKNSSFAMKCIKIASYFSILLPLLIVSTKIVEKIQNRVIFEPSSNAYRFSKAASLLSLVPIIMCIAKVILRWNSTYQIASQNAIPLSIADHLGLDLTETVQLDKNDYDQVLHLNIPESIIMRDAVEEVLNAINQGLADNVNTPGVKNTVLVSTNKYPYYKDSHKGMMGFYNLAVTGSDGKKIPETEETWLYRILKALKIKGFIEIMRDTGHGYTVKVISQS